MKIKLTDSQIEALNSFGTESYMYLINDRPEPIVYIHTRDKTGKRIGLRKYNYQLFNTLDFIGVIRFQREIYDEFYKYVIKRNYVKKLLDINT